MYIIDSPGFGEHPSIDSQIIDYISENEIFAFIYVIKTDNAGGVQEDRVRWHTTSDLMLFCYSHLQKDQ